MKMLWALGFLYCWAHFLRAVAQHYRADLKRAIITRILKWALPPARGR